TRSPPVIERQLERRGAGGMETFPVRFVLLERSATHAGSGVEHELTIRACWQEWGADAVKISRVGTCEIAQQHARRPSVADDVAHRQDQPIAGATLLND